MSEVCSIEGCYKPRLARGWCGMHWRRWRLNGDPKIRSRRPIYTECQADDCSLAPRSLHAEYCETHYYRLRRRGTTDVVRPFVSGQCSVETCESAAHHTSGYCRMHYLRWKKRGDVNFEYRRENNWMWGGDNVTNSGAHQRLRNTRGKAKKYPCVDCGGRAAHWSYDHTDPNERYDPIKGPYSFDMDRYYPRCASCHKLFDLAHKSECAQ